MADVTIDGISAVTSRMMRKTVFISENVGYDFNLDGSNITYVKTTDGGVTWGATVTIDAGTAGDVWYDQWTPGDSGTLIHIFYAEGVSDDVQYVNLDTTDDSLSAITVVFAGATAAAGRGYFVAGTKTRSGRLYCAYDIDAGAEKGLHVSTDGGGTWSASLSATFIEATIDQCLMFPASNTGDDNDLWTIYHDASADALTLKMWDVSAGAAVESATICTLVENTTDGTGQYPFSASVRHSDGHLIVSAITERDTVTADHRMFDINGTGSITELTAITTNIDDHYYQAVFIDQLTDDIYVAYNGKRDGSEVLGTTSKVYYTKSVDGGSSWVAGDTAYMEGAAAAAFQVWAPLMGPRFYPVWRVGSTMFGNNVNSLTFSGGGGSTGTPMHYFRRRRG